MEKAIKQKKCLQCNMPNRLIKTDINKFCEKTSLFGISFFGGARFYTLREIMVIFNLKKKINIFMCTNCGVTNFQCPHCMTILLVSDVKKEVCAECHKRFYFCV